MTQAEEEAGECTQYGNEEDAASSISSATSAEVETDDTLRNVTYPLPVIATGGDVVERDAMMECSRNLSRHLRTRPTLPGRSDDCNMSFTNVETALRLPLFSCPFRGCRFSTDIRAGFLLHVASSTVGDGH